MKISLLLVILCAHCSTSFLTLKDFKQGPLLQCYDDRIENRMTNEIINGQEYPLPSSMEAFISLVERLENAYPTMPATDIIQKLFLAFRVDKLSAGFRKWEGMNTYEIEKAFFNVPDSPSYPWKEEDFTRDEKCALHFMLSHNVNASALRNNQEELDDDGNTKNPRENGVVSLHGKWKHAISLSKVLLGILSGLSGNNQMNAVDIFRKIKGNRDAQDITNVKVNRLIGVTLGDLISVYVNEFDLPISFLPNGMWNDLSCTTRYTLSSNNKRFITNSDLRGAIDGLIIGKKLEEKIQIYQKVRLSQILRMYYGPTGLIEDFDVTTKSDSQWCNRERNLETIVNLKEELNKFHKLYCASISISPEETADQEINEIVSFLSKSSEILSEMTGEASSECSGSEATLDKKCTTPFDIFAILDLSTPDLQRNFQVEVIGNLSLNFDVRPNGNSIGVYTNLNPSQNKGLQIIVNNTGISGCQSCFSKYLNKRGSKNSELQVFENLNQTLTEYVEYYDETQKEITDVQSGAPAKVILYFNYGSPPSGDYKLGQAIWEVEKYFREATILVIGPSKDALKMVTKNDDMDIFQPPSSAANAADFAAKLKSRICKAPAEFQFKECNRSSRTTEAENRKISTISVNKKQYWAMYPKYFLKSRNIVLKFKALEGAQIKVCYSRAYYRIIEDNNQYIECYDSGEEIKFYANNPCHRYNEHNCDPFYFSIEGKKTPTTACESTKCSTLKDIQFEFQHEGISCNSASFLSSSTLALVFAWIMFSILKHSN
ncbi:hypothetical protein JTE90_018743 [Oedothorax gibbosus]|uniref:Uncharacterized protein n=1 Tax=Oedothorax gibbosus TaxID=931172 RepID=A0AAV6UBU4_9ARAC|nr:hypothetical protein JTE90_018743 [Oedothorax gibbosus]